MTAKISGNPLRAGLLGTLLALVLVGCAPATPPSPTAAPTPAPTAAPAAKPTEAPAAKPAEQPAAKASPAAKPALSKAEGAEAKPAASPAAKPAAKIDTKAIEEFYRGKTIRLVVGQAAGGGFDTFGRLVARHLPRHIPGNPNMIVENQGSAGGLIAMNTNYNAEPKDGTAMVYSPGSLLSTQLFGQAGVAFDATKFNWLGGQTRDIPACAVRTDTGFTRLDDAVSSRELVVGGTIPGSSTDQVPNLLRNLLGLNIKVVSGYAGGAPIKVALESGELMGACITWNAFKVTWQENLRSGQVRVIAQGGQMPHPDIPNVPLIRDLAKTDEHRRLIDATAGFTEYIRIIALPPGVPPERIAFLRESFMATLKDRAFLEEAEKARIDIDPIHGEEVQRIVGNIFALSPELVSKLKAALVP